MSNAPVQTVFNYAALAPDTRATVEAATDRLHVLERKTGEQIIEIGKVLIQVKEDLPHGQFLPWLDAEFGWSERAAQNFMSVASRFKSANYADLNVAPSALYALASGNVPQEVRDEFVAKAKAGERVTNKAVKARLAQPTPVDDDEPDDDGPLSDFPYDVVDPYTGEIVTPQQRTIPERREPDPVPRTFEPAPLFTGGPMKPTPIIETSTSLPPDSAALRVRALREILTADANDAASYLVEMDRNAEDLLNDLPALIAWIERFRIRLAHHIGDAGKRSA